MLKALGTGEVRNSGKGGGVGERIGSQEENGRVELNS